MPNATECCFLSSSEQSTRQLASRLATRLRSGDCLTFEGTLGAGKTAFVRALVQALSANPGEEVVSPTFLLVQQYEVTLANSAPAMLWHYDLYRLENERELAELALEEALEGGVVCIEWPAIAAGWLPEGRLAIRIECGDKEGERQITLSGDAGWQARLAGLSGGKYAEI